MKLCKFNAKLTSWKPLIEAWWDVMDHYVKVSRGDLPYWWNEAGNVSFLAAAAWKIGGVAIQEYCVDRGQERPSKGRSDLRLYIPNIELECEMEAKVSWATCLDMAFKDVRASIGQASGQLKALLKDSYRAPVGIALCFVCPMVRSSLDGQPIFKGLLDAFESESETEPAFLAVYEPPIGINLEDEDRTYGKCFYPGVALWGQVVWGAEESLRQDSEAAQILPPS